jgi:DNA-binding CsgD family transcriptional regulator/tetratricopeptide (TPR) repeat protein
MPPAELLERDEQLAALRERLTAAAAGAGSLLFVGGEAGIGKSSLVARFGASVARSARVLVGGCDAMATPRPLGPLVDMAPRLGPPLADLLDDPAARARVFAHLLDAFGERPTVAVFEDVHWADDATLDLLRFLGRRIGGTRALVLATYRHDEVDARHPLRTLFGDLATASSVAHLRVPPLTRAAVARLAAGLGADVDELHRVTAGNPFFVTEVVAAGGRRLPARVQDAVAARLARLGGDARAAVEVASVVGRPASPELFARLGVAAAALDGGLAAGLLVEAEGGVAFRHELAREAVRAGVPAGRRRALHGAVLAVLEAEPADHVDLATLAHHAVEAGDADAIARLAPAAGHRAAALGAHREAWAQFVRALPHVHRLPDEEHTEVLVAYARACDVLGRDADARTAFQTAIERWRAAGRPERWGELLADVARMSVGMGENDAAEAAIAASIDVLERLPAGLALVRAYHVRASLRMLDRDLDAALEWGYRTIELATRLGQHRVVTSALNTVGASHMMRGDPGYAEHYQRALELAQAHGFGGMPASIHVMRGSGAGELHRFDESERYLRIGLELAERDDQDATASYALAWLGLTEVYRGAWDAAAVTIERTLSRGALTTIARIMALVARGRLRVRRGDPEADAPLDEALALALRTDTLQRVAPVRAARAEAAWYAGDLDRVRAEAEAAFVMATRARHPWFVGELGYWLRRAGSDVALPDYAAAPFALQAHGRAAEAADAWTELGCPFEAARAWSEGTLVAHVRDAVTALDALGARVAAQRARERLAELGAKRIPRGPRPHTQDHPAGLTPREAEVLDGLVAGRSNAEIAARHGVSPRTVEHQVSAVLAKLGVDSRAAAIAEAHRRGLVPPT